MPLINRQPLREVLDKRGYIRGPFGSALRRGELLEHGIPVYEQQHAITGSREFRFFIDDKKLQELARFQVRPNDLIISCSGTVGRISVIGEDDPLGIISQALLILRPNPQVMLPEFLYYFLSTDQGQHNLLQASHGSVQVNIAPRAVVEQIEVPNLPLPEQRAIAAILGALDDKIELNRRMNQTLEQMAQALFKSWFVDFDPVHANRNGEAMPGLAPNVQALFPIGFEDSTLGKIPQGWQGIKLGLLIELAYGKPLKAETRNDGDVLVYGSNGQIGWHNEAIVKGPGIIVGRKGNPGTVAWSHYDFYPIDTTFYVSPIDEVRSLHYLYWLLKFENLPFLSADSAVPGLNRNFAYQNDVLKPQKQVLDSFDQLVDLLVHRQRVNDEQSRTLAATRDALLPKLLSGEVRVREAEKIVEEIL